ncbi:hypothetical protein LTS08_001623 [Lithohypha guttulata]|nr:hypothetical protein LTS08_001623 [Lithohypha guttulata]
MGDSSDATDYLKDNRKNIDLDGNDEPLASKKTDPRIQQPSTPRLDEDLKLQGEYNFARFCFYKDVQQIEDFLFLEIVRYALDAANSDVLPFLTDVAIDVIGRMEESLDASFDDDHTYHLKFWTSSQDHSILYETPLLRMQWVIIHARRKLADVDYFNLHPMEQGAVEQHCLASILHEASQVAGPSFGVLSRDSSTKMFDAIFDNLQVQTLDSVMPAAIVFAVRLRILTIIVAKDMVSIGLRSLKQSVEGISELQAKRAAFFNSQDYKSSRVSQLWQSRIKWSLSDWAYTEPSYKDKTQDPFSKLLRSNLLTCCLSRSRLRGDYAAGSVCSIDASGIFRILAHLFNLLSECNILDVDWPDLSFLLSLFGEAYVYHNRRPTLKITSSFTSQIFHSLGLTEKQIAQFFLRPHETQIQKLLMRFKPQFSRHLFPLSMIHCLKQAYLPYQHEIGAIEVKLVAAASVLPKLLGKQSMKVRFTEKCALENKAELWKFCDKRLNMQALEFLSVIKKGMHNEGRTADFDYLRFEMGCSGLVDALMVGCGGLEDSPFGSDEFLCTYDKASRILLEILTLMRYGHPMAQDLCQRRLKKAASVFKTWLIENGSVGIQLARDSKQDSRHLSSLRPDLLQEIEKIVSRRGLMDDVFLPEQISGMEETIKVTGSVEEGLKTQWAEHRKGKRS